MTMHAVAGGKRADADVDAAHTATREMVEETGGAQTPFQF